MDNLTVTDLKNILKDFKSKNIYKGKITTLNRKELINKINEIRNVNIKGNGIIDNIKQFLFFPSSKMPVLSKKVFEKYKDKKITKIKIYRESINSNIQKFLNLVSLNRLEQAKKISNYDDLFHLYMILELDGLEILIEKNENVYIRDNYTKKANNENISIIPDKIINLDELLSNTEKSIGAFKFYQYNAKSNNCQDFLINILKSNNLLDKKTETFIKQDTQQLFDNLPSWSNSFTQLFTDLRAKISELIGYGRKKHYTK